MPPRTKTSFINNIEGKICKTCTDWIPLTNYHKNGIYKDKTPRYLIHCKDCRNRIILGNKDTNPISYKKNKKGRNCIRCKEWKEEENFYKRPNGKLRAYCIQCKREYSQGYIKRIRKEEPEKYQKLLKKKVKFRQTNLHAQLSGNMRSRINNALKGNPKAGTTENLVGCSYKDFRKHLEKQFDDKMNWENRGKWHVEHIIPCAAFNLQRPEEQRRCFNWRNLQPMWEQQNLEKGNKYVFNPVLEISLYFF